MLTPQFAEPDRRRIPNRSIPPRSGPLPSGPTRASNRSRTFVASVASQGRGCLRPVLGCAPPERWRRVEIELGSCHCLLHIAGIERGGSKSVNIGDAVATWSVFSAFTAVDPKTERRAHRCGLAQDRPVPLARRGRPRDGAAVAFVGLLGAIAVAQSARATSELVAPVRALVPTGFGGIRVDTHPSRVSRG